MQIDVKERDGVAILHPDSARIGASDAEAVGSTIREMFDDGRLAIAVDLRSVEFMDLSCLRTLVTEYKYLNRYHGLVCLFNVAPALHDFLQHTVLDAVIDVCEDEEAALAAFESVPKRRHLPRGILYAFDAIHAWVHRLSSASSESRSGGTRRIHPDRRLVTERRDAAVSSNDYPAAAA